ncbi:hypothetical protein DBB34_19135 [Sphaerisporangium cinnabarinum]|nr:hypothetical protein DBB34_19135 [Sphaerisporangium cinnabarinum]
MRQTSDDADQPRVAGGAAAPEHEGALARRRAGDRGRRTRDRGARRGARCRGRCGGAHGSRLSRWCGERSRDGYGRRAIVGCEGAPGTDTAFTGLTSSARCTTGTDASTPRQADDHACASA